MIAPYFRSRGFRRKGNTFSYIKNNISYRIGFEMPTGLIYVTAYIVPLYIPCECNYLSYGNRLSNLTKFEFPILLKDASSEQIEAWCQLLSNMLDTYILPFFEEIGSPAKLAEYLRHTPHPQKEYLHCPQHQIEQLIVYTYLYLLDVPKAAEALMRYHNSVQEPLLVDSYRKRLLTEVNCLSGLIRQGGNSIEAYLAETISHTLQVLGEQPPSTD